MKAAVLVEPGKMVVEETVLLEPEEGQVIVKNHMAAICGSDLHQRYCYFPQMNPDEVLVFKQLDSRIEKSLVCPHTSFIDPTAAPDAAERHSIDIRFMCVFPKEEYPEESWDFALYNFWRPIENPVEKDPLVLIDARTIERKDIINYRLIEEGDKAQAAVPLFNKNQRYCYFPYMKLEIKNFLK